MESPVPQRALERDRVLRSEYRAAVQADPATGRSVRRFCAVAIAINIVLLGIEPHVFPERFLTLLLPHAGAIAALLYVYGFTSYSSPVLGAQVVQLLIGGLCVTIVAFDPAGIASQYTSSLIFSFCAFPIIAPLSVRQIAATLLPIVAAFLVVPQLVTPVDAETYWLHAIFPLIGAIAGLGSAAALDALRFSEFAKRVELERARDELEALDKAKSRFTANVHHELRTPLTLVLAPLEAMLGGAMGEVPRGLAPMLESMRNNGLRLLKLINDLLDLSRIESRQFELRLRSVEVDHAVENIVRGAAGLAERKGIELTTELAPGLPPIQADADALDKVVINLVGNALKFTGVGGSVRVRVEPRPGTIHLCVSDTGIGIPQEQLTRIFDRFAQVDMSEARSYEGTGIGLSLVRELVELHGGRVWAESGGPGCGTEVHVELPSDSGGEAAAGPSARAAEPVLEDDDGRRLGVDRAFAAVGAQRGGASIAASAAERLGELDASVRRWEQNRSGAETTVDGEAAPRFDPWSASASERPEVLVVEDNADMRKLLRTLLEQEFRVRVARSGIEGLKAVGEHMPDVVVSDVMMPGMSGLELTSALKARVETASLPVILVTSKAERGMRAEGLERGADDYVAKPFHPRELLARVRTFARLRRLQHELECQNAHLEVALHQLKLAQAHLVQREQASALGQLVAGVAHEINNPLSFIQGNLEFVAGYVATLVEGLRASAEAAADLPEPGSEGAAAPIDLAAVTKDIDRALDAIGEGVKHTSRTVRDLRTFSRLDRSEVLGIDLHESLDCTLNLLASRLERIEVVREYQALPHITCLAGQLNQVFMSLVANAADAVEDLGAGARITVRTERSGPDRVLVEIADNGPGIPPEDLERIFDPFFTTRHPDQGAGLGLPISLEIVERHGGSLALDSEPGSGTRARVELPIVFAG